MLCGCRRGNQVLTFLSEADLPLEPLAVPLHMANESAPDSSSRGTLVEQLSPENCSQQPYVLIFTGGMARTGYCGSVSAQNGL